MIYKKECACKCGAKFTLMYSGEMELRNLERFGRYHESSAENLMISVENGNPWMMISMKEVPKVINELQEAYKEYEKIQVELKKKGKLESLVKDNKANLSAIGDQEISSKSVVNMEEYSKIERKYMFDEENV